MARIRIKVNQSKTILIFEGLDMNPTKKKKLHLEPWSIKVTPDHIHLFDSCIDLVKEQVVVKRDWQHMNHLLINADELTKSHVLLLLQNKITEMMGFRVFTNVIE